MRLRRLGLFVKKVKHLKIKKDSALTPQWVWCFGFVLLKQAHAIMLMATQSCLSPSPPIIFKHLTKSDDDVVKSESPSSLCSWINQQGKKKIPLQLT